MKALPVLILGSLLLSSCASLSKNECLNADWMTIGYEDGIHGQSRDRIGSHRRACADHGISPNLRAYQQGYDEGLVNFCTPRNGFTKGRSGYQYTGICPEVLEPAFLSGFDSGRELHFQIKEVAQLKRDLQSAESNLIHLDHEIDRKEKILFSDSIPKKKRRRIYTEIIELKRERENLEVERELLVNEIYDADDQLDFLRDKYHEYLW